LRWLESKATKRRLCKWYSSKKILLTLWLIKSKDRRVPQFDLGSTVGIDGISKEGKQVEVAKVEAEVEVEVEVETDERVGVDHHLDAVVVHLMNEQEKEVVSQTIVVNRCKI